MCLLSDGERVWLRTINLPQVTCRVVNEAIGMYSLDHIWIFTARLQSARGSRTPGTARNARQGCMWAARSR